MTVERRRTANRLLVRYSNKHVHLLSDEDGISFFPSSHHGRNVFGAWQLFKSGQLGAGTCGAGFLHGHLCADQPGIKFEERVI